MSWLEFRINVCKGESRFWEANQTLSFRLWKDASKGVSINISHRDFCVTSICMCRLWSLTLPLVLSLQSHGIWGQAESCLNTLTDLACKLAPRHRLRCLILGDLVPHEVQLFTCCQIVVICVVVVPKFKGAELVFELQNYVALRDLGCPDRIRLDAVEGVCLRWFAYFYCLCHRSEDYCPREKKTVADFDHFSFDKILKFCF